jgi:hypothetical protein
MHDVEDIYPLSPLQSGFLFHSLYAPEAGEHLLQAVHAVSLYRTALL